MARTQQHAPDHTKAGSRRGRRWSLAQGREALDGWRDSGLPMAAYARRSGIPVWRLIWWRKRLAQPATDHNSAARTQFLPVTIRQAETSRTLDNSGATIDILLGDDRLVRISDGFNAATLARIIETLERSSC